MTATEVLQTIRDRQGRDVLLDGKRLLGFFEDYSKGKLRPEYNALRVLVECGGNERIARLRNAPPDRQKSELHRLVRELVTEHSMQETMAREICGAVWEAFLGTEVPLSQIVKQQPAPVPPQPVKSAEELHLEAQNCNDETQKVRLLQQAAAKGHTEAMLRLGFAYEYGNGIEKNVYAAVKWFRKAAEQGLAPAQDRLAYCYDKGVGLERNLDKAIEWCQKACDQDFPGGARHMRQLKEKQIRENPSPSPNASGQEFEIVNGALLRYNGSAAEITIPANVTSIRPRAFSGNRTLRSVKLPRGLVGLTNYAFADCTGLKTISIPGSVMAVNLGSFTGCSSLRKITLESGVQKLIFGNHLDQLGRVTIEIPDSVRSVTWSPMPKAQREARMKNPKNIVASAQWISRLQDFFSDNPDFHSGKPHRFPWKKTVLLGLAVLLALVVLSRVMGNKSDKRTRSDLAPYNLEDSIEDMLLAGTDEIYTYPDGTRMEFYYDDAGNEIYRVYVNTENEIVYLFEARYDSSGRLIYHQSFDGQGSLLRMDSYDFHSNEDTAQRRVTLADGRSFQGISTFDENGYETFIVTHEDGTKTLSCYKDNGALTYREQYDAAGEGADAHDFDDPNYLWIDWENVSKVYGPRDTVIGCTSYGFVRSWVQGICGGALKEYSISEDAAFIETYDPSGNLLERLYYRDGQMNELGNHEVHTYDSQGNYTGHTETNYAIDNYYSVTVYDENSIKLSMETHFFNEEGENVTYYRYETELDDQGREIRVQTFDGETGQLKSIDEFEYDSQGNKQKHIDTTFREDGSYSVYTDDGEGKSISDVAYYPSGNVRQQTEYNAEGLHSGRTAYYESGQIERITEYNNAGQEIKDTWYYESGQVEWITEYNNAGQEIKSTWYYENGSIRWFTEHNDQGEVINEVHYYEDGTAW